MIYSYYSISTFVLFGFVSISTTPYVAYHLPISLSPSLSLLLSVCCAVLYSFPPYPTPTGEDTELRYTLQGFGVPVDLIPVTGTGNIKTAHLRQWMNIRKIVETEACTSNRFNNGNDKSNDNDNSDGNNNSGSSGSSTASSSSTSLSSLVVECPGSTDVIFKPGKRLMCHPGNILFQDLIISKTNEYTSMISKRNLYKWLAEEIINKRHGRFLKWNDNGYWTILSDESQIIVKISTSCKAVLNKMKKSINANNNRMTIESSTYAFERQDALINYKRKRSLVDDDTNNNNNNNNNKGQHNGHANYNGGGGGYDASSSTTTATATGGSRSMSWQPFSGCQDL